MEETDNSVNCPSIIYANALLFSDYETGVIQIQQWHRHFGSDTSVRIQMKEYQNNEKTFGNYTRC